MTKTTPTAEYPLGPALDFLRRLWELNHAMERLSGSMERRIGVTAQQRLVLRCVGKYPGIPPGTLAMLLSVDPGTISATVGRLENKGLLERRSDPRDARRTALGLTERGRSLAEPTPGTVEGAVDKLIKRSRPEDLRVMGAVVSALTTLLGEELQRGDANIAPHPTKRRRGSSARRSSRTKS
ncbi:MAG: MarR family transcriptional regulator [Myxococcota bacterium]